MAALRPLPRRTLALAASLAAHGALLALVVWLAPRGRPARPPIPVVLMSAPAAGDQAIPAPTATATSTGTKTTIGTSTQKATPASTSGKAPFPLPRPRGGEGQGEGVPTPAPMPTPSEAWLRAGGLEPSAGSGAPGSPFSAPGTGGGKGGEGGGNEPEAVVAKRVVDGLLADLKARERAVKTPDAYWSEMGSFLAVGFEPGWEVLEGRAEGTGLGIVSERGLREALQGYVADAERYTRSGNPAGADPMPPGARRATKDESGAHARLSADGKALGPVGRAGPDGVFHRELRARVRIWQAEDGRILRARLAETSGNRVYDRAVLERLEKLGEAAAVRLGPTPAQGRETEWAFATSFDVVPPVPVVGCSFDAYFVPGPCFYPLKTSSKSRVDLEAVR